MAGTLYVVGTPIGNLEDLTRRAERLLAEVDLILCEDTRHTGKLLQHLGIKRPLLSCHEHNESSRLQDILERLDRGERLALVSDAGVPAISDPGYRVVLAAREAGHDVRGVPGASAALTALSISGLPTDRFLFVGFLPAKAGARKEALSQLSETEPTLVFYESPHRIVKTLEDMEDVFGGERSAFLGRELTKLHEEGILSTLSQLKQNLSERASIKGEITLVVAGRDKAAGAPPWDASAAKAELESLLAEGTKPTEAAKKLARQYGVPRSRVYELIKKP